MKDIMVRLLTALLLAIGLSVPAFAETDTESILDSSSAQLYEEQRSAFEQSWQED